jgi:hypothetical protein
MDNARPSFEAKIKPLFRERDRRAMTFMFDLWDLEAVKTNAPAILASVSAGEMPCDGRWSEDQVVLFKAWMDGGFEP